MKRRSKEDLALIDAKAIELGHTSKRGLKNFRKNSIIIEGEVISKIFLARANSEMLVGKSKAIKIAAAKIQDQNRHNEAREIKNERVSIYGKIVRETEKAVLFSCQRGLAGMDPELFGEIWFPKSQVTFRREAMGPMDLLSASRWIVDQKAS